MLRSPFRRSAWLLALLATGGCLRAQEKLSVQGPNPATIRLGDSANVVLRIDGASADPREPKLPTVPGLHLELSPPSRSSTSFFDGRTLTEHLAVTYILSLRPDREGEFVVPPFPIWTGSAEQKTPELHLEARKDMRGEELGWIDVQVESKRVYVHEPLRMHIELGVQQGLRLVQGRHNQYLYYDVEVQAPWLADFPAGEPIQLPAPQGDVRNIVGNRTLLPAVFEGSFQRGGQTWQKFSFDRSYLPTQVGRIELPAPMLRYDVLLRDGPQDVFGRPRGQQTDNYFATGKPVVIDVLPIPETGRPNPYYGAVGRFRIDAALDKNRVKLGSSVKLTLSITGQGNFEFLRLPELDALPGLHKLGQAEAKRDAEKVVMTYDLAPTTTDVKEIPAIDWNWFDTTPGVEKFVSAATKPLPLVVLPLERGEAIAPLAEGAPRPVTPGTDDVYDLPDLGGPPRQATALPAWAGWLAVLGPWLLAIAASIALRAVRARAADRDGQRARGALRTCRRALAAGAEPLDALAGYLGDRLGVPAAAVISPDLPQRLVAAGLPPETAGELAAAVERGTAARYGGGRPLEATEVEALLAPLEAVRFGVRVVLPFVLWPLLAVGAFAPAVRAQAHDPAAAAVAAYRAGDFRTAEQGFAEAFAATGDRRAWRARGNCFYRLGDLPRALWAFEAARVGSPRDPELLADLRLVRRQLQVDGGDEGFVAELARLRDGLLPAERAWWCALGMVAAAGLLVFGWRRVGLRWIGVLVLAPAVALAVDLLWLQPNRLPLGIALRELPVLAEPRAGLAPIATVRPGVDLEILGGDQGAFVRVRVGERTGYAARDAVAVVP